jgi:hypothetical protein
MGWSVPCLADSRCGKDGRQWEPGHAEPWEFGGKKSSGRNAIPAVDRRDKVTYSSL